MSRRKSPKFIYRIDEWDKLLDNNFKEGVCYGRPYAYTSPSIDRHRVPCWLWDECFHIIMLAKYNPARAVREFNTLLDFTYSNGHPPMILYLKREPLPRRMFERVFWKRFLELEPPGIALTQPPLHAEAANAIYSATGDIEFIRTAAPVLKKIYRYFAKERDLDGDSLISIVHPLENGMDSLPVYDPILYGKRGALPFGRFAVNYGLYKKHSKDGWDKEKIFKRFNYECPAFNALYAYNLEVFANLLEVAGDEDESEFRAMSARVTRSMLGQMYDEETGLFYGIFHNEQQPKIKTVASLMPIILDIPSDVVARLHQAITDPILFATRYPIPSVAKNEPTFFPGRTPYLWRGTAWVNTNRYVTKGLVRHSGKNSAYFETARHITLQTKDMVKRNGHREYYNSLTGDGYGDREHSWTTLIIDMLELVGLPILD